MTKELRLKVAEQIAVSHTDNGPDLKALVADLDFYGRQVAIGVLHSLNLEPYIRPSGKKRGVLDVRNQVKSKIEELSHE